MRFNVVYVAGRYIVLAVRRHLYNLRVGNDNICLITQFKEMFVQLETFYEKDSRTWCHIPENNVCSWYSSEIRTSRQKNQSVNTEFFCGTLCHSIPIQNSFRVSDCLSMKANKSRGPSKQKWRLKKQNTGGMKMIKGDSAALLLKSAVLKGSGFKHAFH